MITYYTCNNIFMFKVASGAVGLCCQTLVEAEAIVYGGGCNDILLSNQVSLL